MAKNDIFEINTSQAKIRIENCGDELHLKFDSDLEAIQSVININRPYQLVMENLRYLMGILLFIAKPRKILLLGVGGGSLVHFIRHYLPQAHLTGVEHNQELLDIAHTHLNLPQPSRKLEYIIADARDYLTRCETSYDLILLDIFNDGQSPAWLLNKPTTRLLKSCLSDRGAVAYNLLLDSEKKFQHFYRQIRQIFIQQTLCMETEEYENLLVYGLNFEATKRTMPQHLQRGIQLGEKYGLPFNQILSSIYSINPIDSGVI